MILKKSCKNIKKYKSEKRFNIRAIINILLLVVLVNLVLTEDNKNISEYIINLEIKGMGNLYFLNENFSFEPSEIYINGNKINQTIYSYNFKENENNVTLILNYSFTYSNNMFQDVTNMKKINFKNFKNNTIINMNNMFLNCINLESINFSDFDTSQVIYMNGLFNNCSKLKY